MITLGQENAPSTIPVVPALTALSATVTLGLSGSIAGFFYAYACSVMFGLEAIDPRHAVAAMQGINATVRNMAFAPAFFGTPVMALVTALLFACLGRRAASWIMAGAALVYVAGAFLPTLFINVPMNEALARVTVPESLPEAARLWAEYAGPWTRWNTLRTVFSLLALLLVGLALFVARARG
ncbi:anthrone oxygenase family protein [Microvirga sp. CF3016]|uniref:anthrone oxygenase family protein n=1 Tax=Microvirga sp. CF3016 TaxID=3110181 RepID=UPI002E77C5E4|nr:anthrone oxygenase family protein [Microvirga sp. CF3016]MEE1610609.1 anthrone oxygenase family protein [Microvirga sp. CF3016]